MHSGKHIGQRLNNCSLLKDACTYFDSLLERDVFLWNIIIGLHARHGKGIQSLQLFQQMQQESVIPDNVTLVHVLSIYTRQELLGEGKRLHSCMSQDRFEFHVFLGTALLTMYGKLGRTDLAEMVFRQMTEQDVALWNAMINTYAQNGHANDALQVFGLMQLSELGPDKVTFACILGVCASLAALEKGRLIHTCIICMQMEYDPMVATSLVNMYGKCSNLDDAQSMFNKLPQRDVITWNALIAAYVEHGKDKQALHLFFQMHQEGVIPVKATFVSIFGALSGEVALAEGKRVHTHIACRGLECDKVITTALLNMYGSCGSMEEAEQMFDGMVERSKVSWNAMISEHVQNRHGKKAFQLFDQMLWEGQVPDKVTFLSMLSACVLEETLTGGKYMHSCIIYNGYESEVAVATALVSMYGKLGSLENAQKSFDKMHERNIISWNGLIKAHVLYGNGKEALGLLDQLKQEGLMPNKFTFVSSLSICSTKTDLVKGKQLHACIDYGKTDLENVFLNALVNMYTKCGSLEDALLVFDKMSNRDVFSWNGIMEAWAQRGDRTMAFRLLDQMRHEGVVPNKVTFISILESCLSSRDLCRGREVHTCIAQGDFREDVAITSALVKMYGAGGSYTEARKIFDTISDRDMVLWNTMISVYTHEGHCKQALQMLDQMQQEGEVPTSITYISLFSACASCASLVEGMRLHSCIRCTKLELDVALMNSLIFMYGKCGNYEVSERLFNDMPKRDRVAWTGMIAVSAEHDFGKAALQLFHQMMTLEGISPDKVTLVSTLSACACNTLLAEGREIHTHITLLGFESDIEVANGLVNMYGKCGSLEEAWTLFDKLSNGDAYSWNVMIASLLYHGHDIKAIHLFEQMQQGEVYLSEVTFVSILSACANLATLIDGRHVHASITCDELDSVTTVANSLISMYGKCGSLEDALSQFNKLSERDMVSWNVMIAAYAQHGCGKEALELLDQMQRAGVLPNQVSFLTTISACSHTGLVDTCCGLWVSMSQDSSIKLVAEHYDCLIDVFSRCGRLVEAEHLITNMPFQPCHVSWMTLLSACKDQANVVQGLQVAQYLFEMDPDKSSTCVMLSNIHAAASRMSILGS